MNRAFDYIAQLPQVLRQNPGDPPGSRDGHTIGKTPDAVDSDAAERALTALPPELKARLGALVDAPQDAAELAIALFPYGYRALLNTYGLIETTVPDDEEDRAKDSPRRRIRLLDLGRRIIDACADPPAPVGPMEDLDSQAADLRERYGEALPFEIEEAED